MEHLSYRLEKGDAKKPADAIKEPMRSAFEHRKG
jgi:hypothetical protein